MEQTFDLFISILNNLNKGNIIDSLDKSNEVFDEICKKNQTSKEFLKIEEVNTLLSLLSRNDDVKGIVFNCLDKLSKLSTEQFEILTDSKMVSVFEKIMFDSDEKYINRILEIYKTLFSFNPPSPIKEGTLIRDFDYYDYIMYKNSEDSDKIKAKLSRLILPIIKNLLSDDGNAILQNRGCLLFQSYYDSNFKNKTKYLLMFGIDKIIINLIDKNECVSSELIHCFEEFLSEMKIFPSCKEQYKENTIMRLISDLEKDLSYDNCISVENKSYIIDDLCYITKVGRIDEEFFHLLDYMLFIGEEKRIKDNLEVNPYLQEFLYYKGDLIVEQYQYEFEICKNIILSYLPYKYDHYSKGWCCGVQYLVDNNKVRKVLKRELDESKMKRIKIIRISRSNFPKINAYIQSMKILNSFYYVENVVRVCIKEVNCNEIIISEKEYKMNLNGMQNIEELKNNFCEIALDIIDAVGIIHDLNMVHGNINLCNIFIEENNQIYLDDQFKNHIRDKSYIPLSSLQHLSPEFLTSKEITTESDIFSMGVVMNFILNGVKLFEGNSFQTISSKILNSDKIVIEKEENELNSLIHRMINKKKEERPVLSEIRSVIEREHILDNEYVNKSKLQISDYFLEILISNNALLPEEDYYGERCFVIIIDKYKKSKLLWYYGILVSMMWKPHFFNGIFNRLHFKDKCESHDERENTAIEELILMDTTKYKIDLRECLMFDDERLIEVISFFPYIPQLKTLDLSENDLTDCECMKELFDNLSYLTNLEKLNLSYNDFSEENVELIKEFDENIKPSILPKLKIHYKDEDVESDDE